MEFARKIVTLFLLCYFASLSSQTIPPAWKMGFDPYDAYWGNDLSYGTADTMIMPANNGKFKLIDSNGVYSLFQTPHNCSLNSIIKITPDKFYIVGDSGVVMKNISSLTDWQDVSSGTTQRLVDGAYNGTDLFVVGTTGTLLRDSALMGNFQSYDLQTAISLNDITFLDNNVGIIVCDSGVIYRTINGGSSWTRMNVLSNTNKIIRCSRANNTTVCFCTKDAIYRSINSGLTWQLRQQYPSGNFILRDVFYTNTDTGFVVGKIYNSSGGYYTLGDFVAKTTTDFKNMYEQEHLGSTDWFYRGAFKSSKEVAIFSGMRIMKSKVGGTYWHLAKVGGTTYSEYVNIEFGYGQIAPEIVCINDTLMYAGIIQSNSTSYRLWKSKNKGATWDRNSFDLIGSSITSLGKKGNNSIMFSGDWSSDNFYCTINAHTGDTSNYTVNSFSQAQFFYTIEFRDSLFGYAISHDTIYHTVDGGLTWTQNKLPGNTSIYHMRIKIFGGDTLVVGPGFWRSYDAGATWTTPNDVNFTGSISCTEQSHSAIMISSKIGFLITNANLYKTVDGGDNWAKVSNVCNLSKGDIYFVNKDTGFVYGGDKFYGTVDGGHNWLQMYNPIVNGYQGWGRFIYSNNRLFLCTIGSLAFVSDDFMPKEPIPSPVNIHKENVGMIRNVISVFPNPAHDKLFIRSNSEITSYTLYNMLGEEVMNVKLSGAKETSVDVSKLSKGLYLLSIPGNGVYKVVVE